MNKKYIKDLTKAFESLKEVERLMDDRIIENNRFSEQLQTQQATHAFVLYRKIVWKAKYLIRDILNEEGQNLIG